MALLSSLLVAIAVQSAYATRTTNTKTRQCVQLEIPIKLSSFTTTKWQQPRVDSTVDAVDWVDWMTTWTTPADKAAGNVTINGTFKINGQLCVPPEGAKSDILQIATHGVGFDKRYWDVEIKPEQYSWVDYTLAQGYSIFTYDRLGTGSSDKPDAYDIVQTDDQVEILRQLTLLLRSGKLISSSKKLGGVNTLDRYTPDKIVHVGHSFGSICTIGLLQINGSISDGAILTGFLPNNQLGGISVGTWGFEFARESDPKRFSDRGSGYIVQKTKYNVLLSFLKKGSFEPALLDYAEQIKQPNSVSEFVSIGAIFGTPAKDFKAPVQFVVGENDYGFCRGECYNTYNITEIETDYYPAASKIAIHIQPKTGHGLALSTNATAGYKATFDFLRSVGL
ncbi:hypothetical protein CONLIGDRAFT_102057 [Coniochaeta ligniaria NRRL 30616]|uniref:AB hydrolase-1 domain-containing protein n=1 Tax=Coniochaeta ligniaria NRRL 30616 TaxID=1408157 RepID=A0A1J7J674_9PEZI|nr:hypothetical protein CONLIGDRAFT_102057 [Coniochaeta ligniaria NRRL 30616]